MLDNRQNELLAKHLDLVIEWNKKVNITRIDDKESARLLHIEDSLSAIDEVNNAPEGRMGDLGSGAGYPGIPLAIATGRQTTLIEARKKKAEILSSMIEELGLNEQVDVFCGRAELLARKEADAFAVLTARALAKLSVLMELASPLLAHGGILVCYKSHVEKNEYDNARRVQPLTGLTLVSDRRIVLDDDDEFERRVICFKKNSKPETKLPRKEGMAQSHPL